MGGKRARGRQSRRDAIQGVTQAAFARGRGISREAIRKAVESGRIRLGRGLLRNGRLDPKAADRALRDNADPRGGPPAKKGAPKLYEEKARREAALAQLAELELEQARGNVVLRSDVKTMADETARLVKERLLALPERVMEGLESLGVRDTVRARKLLNDELRRALEGLAGELVPTSQAARSEPAA